MADVSLHFNTKEFTEFLKKNKKDLILVDFYADWCPHCRAVGPILENLARTYKKQNVHIIKIDTDVEQKLATEYKVEYLPTLILLQGGKELERETGGKPASFLEEMIKKHLDK